MLCWTLGITEHHNAVDNVLSLINLALLTGHVGRYGSGLNPLRGQNNVQGGGDMGAIPNQASRVFSTSKRRSCAANSRERWGAKIPPSSGWHLSRRCSTPWREASYTGPLRHRRKPAAVGGRPGGRRERLGGARNFLVVQDILPTRTAELADVVLPCGHELVRVGGHGDEQRAARAARSQGVSNHRRQARDDISNPLRPRPRAWVTTGDTPAPKQVWNELRSL